MCHTYGCESHVTHMNWAHLHRTWLIYIPMSHVTHMILTQPYRNELGASVYLHMWMRKPHVPHVCHMSHRHHVWHMCLYVWGDFSHMRNMTHLCGRCGSRIHMCATWLTESCMTCVSRVQKSCHTYETWGCQNHVCHMCATRLIDIMYDMCACMCEMSYASRNSLISACVFWTWHYKMTCAHARHDSCICVAWLTHRCVCVLNVSSHSHVCHMSHRHHVWHVSLVCKRHVTHINTYQRVLSQRHYPYTHVTTDESCHTMNAPSHTYQQDLLQRHCEYTHITTDESCRTMNAACHTYQKVLLQQQYQHTHDPPVA